MTKVYNTKWAENRRQVLRKNLTPSEKIFWSKVRAKQFYGIKFRRQFSVWMYILDFYCTEKKLCIEIDWDTHYTEEWKWYDEVRTEYLSSAWIKVIRFTNIDIKTNIEWVLEIVKKELWIHSSL